MSWLKWIWAYLFDCVHSHITWPHRDRCGFAYVACLDCGRDLPYSLESMRILTKDEQLRDRKRTRMGAGTPVTACLALLAALVFLNSNDAIAQAVEVSDAKIADITVEHAPATLVVVFGGDMFTPMTGDTPRSHEARVTATPAQAEVAAQLGN